MTWFSFFLGLFGLSWASVGVFLWYVRERGWMIVHPNARSSHFIPTPRGGGLMVLLGSIGLFGFLYYYSVSHGFSFLREWWLFLPALAIGFIGFIDDVRALSASIRFAAHLVGSAAVLFLLGESGEIVNTLFSTSFPLPICFILLIGAMTWMINLYNFMDGSDGLAAMEGMFVFGVGGYFLLQYDATALGVLAWGEVALLGGFLTWNWPVARVFMGDSGSCFLGFLIGIMALISYKYFQMPMVLWAILTGLFWFDATVTLVRRIVARQPWGQAHRTHAYQRLIQGGWSHFQVLLGAALVNTLLAGLAFIAHRDPRLSFFALGLACTLLTCIYILIEVSRPMFKAWYET